MTTRQSLISARQQLRRWGWRSPLIKSIRYRMNNPFEDSSNHIIMHTAHHKVGTSWFAAIMQGLGEEFGIDVVKNDPAAVRPGKSILYFQNRVLVTPEELKPYRSSHMVRDPRDVIISGYYYHLWTKEPWANKKIAELPQQSHEAWSLLPLKDIGHLTYVEYLNSLSKEDGILAEMARVRVLFREMFDWDYANECTLNFRYEDIMTDEKAVLRRIFRHYGFHERAVEKATSVAANFGFQNRSGRSVGKVSEKNHIRSGKLQQWKTEFTVEHKDRFKELYGDALIRMGYESDLNW